MGISHIMLKVKELASSKAFYTAALTPLGYKVSMEFPGMVALASRPPAILTFGSSPLTAKRLRVSIWRFMGIMWRR
jgi:catechol 2,3-dioxygenase-like lactoylglutathione lyase family enzyme